jgi:hypothetical protein
MVEGDGWWVPLPKKLQRRIYQNYISRMIRRHLNERL